MKTNYTADRMVFFGTGGINHASLVQLAENHFSSLPGPPKPTVLERALYPNTNFLGVEARCRDDTSVNFALHSRVRGRARQPIPR